MLGTKDNSTAMRKLAVCLATVAVSAVFFGMIWDFLTVLFLAAVSGAMAYPLYRRVLAALRGRKAVASALTLMILVLCVLLPGFLLLSMIASQAVELSEAAKPWIEQRLEAPRDFRPRLPDWLPFKDRLESLGPQIAAKLGELAGKAGGFLLSSVSTAMQGTAHFFLSLFVFLYALFFFLQDGPAVLVQLMRYTALPREAQDRLIEKTVSVSRATIKGTLVIGLVQGFLGGIGLAVAGVPGAAFWGAVMAVASVIPGIGTALVWIPAVVYLVVTGATVSGVGLAIWSAVVVGTVDNVLRPKLVGGDTQMPDLLILISTFGGLTMFGAAGLVIGPVIAALFVAMWEIFLETFRDVYAGASPAESGDTGKER